MNRRILNLLLVITAPLLLFSCGPQKVFDETSKNCYPENLQVDVNSGTMDVYWQMNCERLISGYNIYISENPIAADHPGTNLPRNIKPFNLEPFAGDTNPDDAYEHFIADQLENGKKYYVSVRVVNPDLSLSRPSNEIVAICGPSGEIELSIRYKSDKDGFSFDRNEYVRADALDNDFYFYSNKGEDYLNSPSKLDGFLRQNLLIKLKMSGTFADVRTKTEKLSRLPKDERVRVKKGDWLRLRTSDGANALIKVLDIYGEGKERKIKLFFVYNHLPDELIF